MLRSLCMVIYFICSRSDVVCASDTCPEEDTHLLQYDLTRDVGRSRFGINDEHGVTTQQSQGDAASESTNTTPRIMGTHATSETTILAMSNPSNIQVVGRHRATAAGIAFDMPGVTIRSRFTGTNSIGAMMSKIRAGGDAEDHFVVFCNGVTTVPSSGIAGASFSTDDWSSDEVATIRLCSGLDASAINEVEIFKASEAQWGAHVVAPNYVTFSAFVGSSGLQLLDPPPLPDRKLEFLGDSITAGYCNLCSDELHPTGGVNRESFDLSWPTLVGRQLSAQVHTAAWSGYGMAENCCGGSTLMSDVWKRTLATVPASDPSDPHGTNPENSWNFEAWKPDAVVINLGTNDKLHIRPQLVDSYQRTYLDIVLSAHSAYGPGTHFFLACGPMDEHYCDSVSWVLDEASARGIDATFLDQRGFLDGSYGEGCCGHPGREVDVAMAESATRVITQAMGW